MCGFSLFYEFEQSNSLDYIDESLNSILHRGPDDNGKIVLKDTVINDESVFVEPEKRDCDIVFQDFSLF